MNIVIADDCGGMGAHSWQRKSMARALVFCGHDVTLWDIDKHSPYDCFDLHNPEIFIGQTYNVNQALINCISERPALKVIMKASDWGNNTKEVSSKYPILTARKDEIENLISLKEKTNKPDGLFIHYHEDYIGDTHTNWINLGFNVYSDLNAADVFEYTNGEYRPEYDCKIGYVGGSWDYKNIVLHPYLLPLCENFDYNIKIFGKGWTIPQSCGFLPDGEEKHFYKSAKINLCLHEPHSHKHGFDITEKFFKLAIGKNFTICDNVAGLEKLYPNVICSHKTPEKFINDIKLILNDWNNYHAFRELCIDSAYKITLKRHTYFDRIYNMFNILELEEEANNVLIKKKEIIKRLKL